MLINILKVYFLLINLIVDIFKIGVVVENDENVFM